MTDRLAEIEARLKAATPGPWAFANTGEKEYAANVGAGVYAEDDENCDHPLEGDLTNRTDDYYIDQPIAALDHQRADADARFIANAPSDISWLIAELRTYQHMSAVKDRMLDEYEQLRASGAVSEAAAQPAPSGNANSRGSQEVTEADRQQIIDALAALDEVVPWDARCHGETLTQRIEWLKTQITNPAYIEASRRSPREGAAPTPGDTVWQNEGASAAAETLRRETTGRAPGDQT